MASVAGVPGHWSCCSTVQLRDSLSGPAFPSQLLAAPVCSPWATRPSQANDPLELALGAGEDVFFDTALIHGHPQRVRIHQVLATVPPIVQECMAGVRALRRTHAAITAKRQEVAGAAIVRIARGRLGRLRAAERRYFLTMQAAAVAIQAAYWGYVARRYTVPRAIARRRHLAATAIQALARGHRTRLWFARVRQLEDFRVANQAAERIQAAWKGRLARARKHETFAAAAREKEEWAERRQARLVAARARREAKRQFAATTVQRIVRGFFARREAYMRRQQGYVAHPRARALANAFLAGGDVWGLLAAVSRDFERHDAERDQEQRQASAFVAQMVQLREGQEARDWDEWMAVRGGGAGSGSGGTRRTRAQPAPLSGVDGGRSAQSASLLRRPGGDVTLGEEDLRLALMERMYLRAGQGGDGAPGPGAESSRRFLGAGGGTGTLSAAMALTGSALLPLAPRSAADAPSGAGHGAVGGRRGGRSSSPPFGSAGRASLRSAAAGPGGRSRTPGQHFLLDDTSSSFLAERTRRGRAREGLGLPPGADPDAFIQTTGSASASLRQLSRGSRGAGKAGRRHGRNAPAAAASLSLPDLPPAGSGTDSRWQSAAEDDAARSAGFVLPSAVAPSPARAAGAGGRGEARSGSSGRGSGGHRPRASDASSGSRRTRTPTRRAGHGAPPARSVSRGSPPVGAAGQSRRRGGSAGGSASPAPGEGFQPPTLSGSAALQGASTELPTALRSAGTLPPLTLLSPPAGQGASAGDSAVGARPGSSSSRGVGGGGGGEGPPGGAGSTTASNSKFRFSDGSVAPPPQSTAASLHAGESLWGGPEGATRSLEATRRSAVESLRLKSALILQGDASAPTQTGGDADGGDGDSGAARDAGNGVTTPRLAAGAGAGPAATPGGNTMAIVPFGPAAPGAEGGGPQGNGETSAASRGDAASLEDLLASRSMGRPPALSLLRDVRGLDGPYDALVLHAALRVVPIPSGVLTWCADNGVPLSRETAQAAEAAAARGSLMGAAAAPPHRRPGSRVRIAADFDRTGTGEEAARVFADLPPSLLKVRWENEARKIAAPAVAALHRQGVRCVRDVLTVDLEGSGIDPVLVGAIHRLVRVMAVAEQMVTPSAVRAKFASRAAPMPPPLFGPGRAAVGGAGTEAAVAGANRPFGAAAGAASGALAIRRGGARRRKPQRPGRAADRGSAHASGTGGRRRSRDSSDGSPHEREHEEEEEDEEEEEEGSGIGAAGLGAPPEASSSTLPYWSAAAAGTPGSGLLAAKRPALRGRAGRKAAGAPAALFVTRSSAAGAPVAVPVHGIAGQGGAEERKAGDGAAMTRWGAGRTGAAASVIYAETGLFGQYGEATEYAAEDDRGDAAMRAKARSGATLLTPSNPSGTVPAAYTRAGRAAAAAAAAGAGKAAPHGARAGPQSRGRGASSFGADRDQTGTRLGADEIELPAGFEVLERDEALTAQGIRRAAQDHSRRDRRRVELAAERGKARAIAAEATQRALAALRRGDTAAGVSSSGSGDRGGDAPSVGQALAEASRLVGTSATPMAGESISAGEIEGTMVSMLNRLHASVNTLSAVDSLEAPVDPACLQAALRMPLPMPTLTQMVDYRAGRNRSEAERAKVVVPYDLFLRQLVAYEAAAAAGVLARAGGAGSRLPSGDEAADHAARVAEAEAAAAQKQRMLVRERLAVAEAMARPWVRALGRGGFTRIGQLVKMPRLELERSLASAYPIKPEGGVTLAGRRAQEVAGGIPPHKAAAAVEAALEHWIATRPDIADAVYLRVTSFDPRFQRSAADSRGAGPGARAFGDLAAQRRPLASADWRTFQRQRYNIGSATGSSSRAGTRGGGASRRGAPEQPGSAVDALD